MIFPTTINGTHCLCDVDDILPWFEFRILGLDRRPAPHLARQVTPEIEQKLCEDYRILQDAEYFAPINL